MNLHEAIEHLRQTVNEAYGRRYGGGYGGGNPYAARAVQAKKERGAEQREEKLARFLKNQNIEHKVRYPAQGGGIEAKLGSWDEVERVVNSFDSRYVEAGWNTPGHEVPESYRVVDSGPRSRVYLNAPTRVVVEKEGRVYVFRIGTTGRPPIPGSAEKIVRQIEARIDEFRKEDDWPEMGKWLVKHGVDHFCGPGGAIALIPSPGNIDSEVMRQIQNKLHALYYRLAKEHSVEVEPE